MAEDRSETRQRRVTVAEAAEVLGLTVEAVRGRIKRGKLEHVKEDGAVYVILDADQTATGQTGQQPVDDRADDRSERVEDLKEQIAYLRRQLDEEREARRRADTILAQLSAATAEQARTIRAIESPVSGGTPSEPRGGRLGAAGEAEGHEEQPFTEEAQEGAEPRSWWRRWFGTENEARVERPAGSREEVRRGGARKARWRNLIEVSVLLLVAVAAWFTSLLVALNLLYP